MNNSDAWNEGPFDDTAMARLAGIAKLPASNPQMLHLRDLLQRIGSEFRRVLSTTPSQISLSKRLEWLDAQVLNPLEKLLAAVDPNNRNMFSLWPEEVDEALLPNFEEVTTQLEHLQLLARNVAIVAAKYRFHDLPLGQLIRYRIVHSVADALADALPQVRPTRGTYDKETKGFNGTYPDLIRAIYEEITGESEQLDHLIKEQVEHRRM